MAIRDLLWACPACGEPNGLIAVRRGEVCRACGARVRRGRGANIVVEVDGRPPLVRPAWEWCDLLPDAQENESAQPSGAAILREADSAWPLRQGKELLGFVERFGQPVPGRLTLADHELRFDPESGGEARVWPLLEVTAVQPASSALQLKLRDRPVVTFRFLDCSVRRWERRIQDRMRRAFRAADRGEIVEFQPRVSFR